MAGGFGQTDIYFCLVNEDGTLGTAVNLGSKVNTLSKENFPFINKKNELYFASSGHNTFGGFDIFMISLNDSLETYKKPKNLGESINSIYDDFAYIEKNDSSGFFASNRIEGAGKDDIYQFSKLPAPYENNEHESTLKMLFHQFDFENSSIPLVELNEDGSYTSEKGKLMTGKYFLFSEDSRDHRTELIKVHVTDYTYDYESILKGKFYAIKDEPSPISKSRMVLETIKIISDSTYLSQKEINVDEYYLISKDQWLTDELKNSLNQLTFKTNGTFSSLMPMTNGNFYLLSENTSWVSKSTENMNSIQFLDDRTYTPRNLISNGKFYLLPLDTGNWSQLGLNFQTISIEHGKTFRSESAIHKAVYYLIPKLNKAEESNPVQVTSKNSEIIFYEKSTLLSSDAQLELLKVLIQMRHFPNKKLTIKPVLEAQTLDSEMTTLLRKRHQKIVDFLLNHGAEKDRITIQELNIKAEKSQIDANEVLEVGKIRIVQKFQLELI